MFTSSSSLSANKSFTTNYKKNGTEPQRILGSYLYDDTRHVLSSFDMNKIASLTFGNEAVCNEIFDMLEKTLSSPSECSVLNLDKTLRSVHHIVIYGHERSISLIQQRLRHHIGRLISYNTALQSSTSVAQSIMGGVVDTGGPVRSAAQELYNVISKPMASIQQLRETSADPNSLVPVGKKDDTLGYQSEAYLSKPESERMGDAASFDMKSNLAKGEGGYGGGLYLRDASGKVVIGAAHSMEEMMQMAASKNKQVSTYSDEPSSKPLQPGQVNGSTGNSDYTRQMLASDLLDLDFQAGIGAPPSTSDPFMTTAKEVKLQQELEKQKKELEELKNKFSSQAQLQNQQGKEPEVSLNVTAERANIGIFEVPQCPADTISSLENLAPYTSNTMTTTMTSSYDPPQQPSMALNIPEATFEATAPEANFQFQVMGGDVMGGGISAPKRNLHSGESAGLGDIPLPPQEMPPPPPPPSDAMNPTGITPYSTNNYMPPPANVSYNTNEDDTSSYSSAINTAKHPPQPQQQQMMMMNPQTMSPQTMNPQMMTMPQQQQMMMMSNQPQMMMPQQMMMNPMMPQQQQQMMMSPQQQQQQMMMMNQNQPQSMMMNSNMMAYSQQQPQQPQQQNSMYMTNNAQQQQQQQPQQSMIMMNPQMMNPQMMNPQMMMMPQQQPQMMNQQMTSSNSSQQSGMTNSQQQPQQPYQPQQQQQQHQQYPY